MLLIGAHNLLSLTLINVPVTAKSCATLSFCEKLEAIALVEIGFNDVDAVLLADAIIGNMSLTSVDLSGNNIGDAGYTFLRNCVEKNMVIEEK